MILFLCKINNDKKIDREEFQEVFNFSQKSSLLMTDVLSVATEVFELDKGTVSEKKKLAENIDFLKKNIEKLESELSNKENSLKDEYTTAEHVCGATMSVLGGIGLGYVGYAGATILGLSNPLTFPVVITAGVLGLFTGLNAGLSMGESYDSEDEKKVRVENKELRNEINDIQKKIEVNKALLNENMQNFMNM